MKRGNETVPLSIEGKADPEWPTEDRGLIFQAETQIQKAADMVSLRHSPPGVLINTHMEIIQFRGETALYLEQPPGKATLNGTTVSWIEATKDDPSTPEDDRKYKSCLKTGSPDTKPGSAKLADALPTMMWESHNRTLDAVLDKYGPDNITDRGQQLGLTQTEMHFGCPQPNGPSAPWAANRSTL